MRRRHLGDDGFKDVLRPDPLLGRREDDLLARDAGDVGDLLGDHLGLRGVEVDLVDDRDDGQPRLHRLVEVGERLRFYALRGVDDEDRAFARRERA